MRNADCSFRRPYANTVQHARLRRECLTQGNCPPSIFMVIDGYVQYLRAPISTQVPAVAIGRRGIVHARFSTAGITHHHAGKGGKQRRINVAGLVARCEDWMSLAQQGREAFHEQRQVMEASGQSLIGMEREISPAFLKPPAPNCFKYCSAQLASTY